MMIQTSRCLVLASIVAGCCVVAVPLHAETWTDSTGKFKIEAEYAGVITNSRFDADQSNMHLFYMADQRTLRIQSEQPASLRILDLTGRSVKQSSSATHITDIDLHHLPPAVYSVHLTNGQSTISRKIVVR